MTLGIPSYGFRSFPIITTTDRNSLALDLSRYGGGLPASTAWATANQARFVPFWLAEPTLVVKLLAYNGATTGGTTAVGVYDANGNLLIDSGAVTMAGTNGWQEFDTTDTNLLPGLYYVGLLNTTTTATFFAFTISKEFLRAMGIFSQAVGAGTLPNPATFAAIDAAILPCVGLAARVLTG